MSRLNSALLATLDTPAKPTYDRTKLLPGIVHLGIGAFHRAHQAWYTEAVLNSAGGNWGIIGCSLRSDSVSNQLDPQDGLYTILERSAQDKTQIIGAVVQVLVGPQKPQAIIDAIATESIKIISLTVTEKGYCHFPATGELNFEHPDIAYDLGNITQPKSAIGYIVAGLIARKDKGLPGLTVLSCDNLPNNGKVVGKCVIGFAEKISAELASWIKSNVTFPCSMIDRIVPATTPTDISNFENTFGYEDAGMVVAEPFSQWVIEDNFIQGRPAWETVGATLVEHVEIYELIKLRLLNGTHSLLAYSGYLAGKATIAEVMRDATLTKACKAYMALAAGTLAAPADFDLAGYQAQLVERFANPGLQHRTWQIAMDGSQKIPQRWLGTLADAVSKGADIKLFAFALAAWMKYISAVDEQGKAIEVSDPLAKTFAEAAAKHAGSDADYVNAIFAIEGIFNPALLQIPKLKKLTTQYLSAIKLQGALKTLDNMM